MTMENFVGLAVLLLAVGGAMALEVPMQVFAGLAVCLLAGAVFALWTVMQDVKHMAWAVESNSSKLLDKVAATKKKKTTKKQQHV